MVLKKRAVKQTLHMKIAFTLRIKFNYFMQEMHIIRIAFIRQKAVKPAVIWK